MSFHLEPSALDRALEHLELHGDSDILPPAFELQAIRHVWDSERQRLADADLDVWTVGPRRRCLSPKQHLGLRVATQLDPIDAVLATALVIQIAEALEAVRLPIEDRTVHSHRFVAGLDHGRLFSPDFNFYSFRDRSLELAKDCDFVLLTDISDFYPRIYLHRVENALRAALGADDGAARVLNKFLTQWNQSISYGLPVGASAFRLVAEVTINDVDQALAARGYRFCRYSDDFRFFVASEREGREVLAFLARALSNNHGLTLQAAKTELISAEDFTRRFRWSEQDEATGAVQENLHDLLATMDFDMYDPPSFAELPEEVRAAIDIANVWTLLEGQLDQAFPNMRTVRFALQQIRWWGLADDDGLILDRMRQLDTVFSDAIEAATASPDLTPEEKKEIAERLLDLVDDDVFGHLEYFRAWILSVFADSAEWNHSPALLEIHARYSDSFTRGAAVLALGVAGVDHWFRTERDQVLLMDPWERRAFLAGAACLPKDERKHWYASVKPQLTPLELAVVEWAKANAPG